MKRMLLSCICLTMAAAVMSCSGDDNGDNTNSGGTTSTLATVTQKMYEEGSLAEIHVSEYTDGRMAKTRWFTPENVETGYTQYVYDNRGLLVTSTDFVEGKAFADYEYQYDEQGRIKKMKNIPGDDVIQVVTYTYNGNTVTGTRTVDGWTEIRTFYIDSNGNVYKQHNSGSDTSYEITFEGNTPLSMTSNFGTVTYEHDNTHNYGLLNLDYGTGNYKPNLVLRTINLMNGLQSHSNKYITKQTFSSLVTRYVYTFNEQGLPLTRKDYRNDVLTDEYSYTYK